MEKEFEKKKRERVRNFTELGFGLVIHWGMFSLFEKGEWFQCAYNISPADYRKRLADFTADKFDARQLARTARKIGAGFIILTSRHHDGFSLYDTKGLNDFDAPHSPAGRDLIKEFTDSCREEGILPIIYHTTLDWQWKGKYTQELTDGEFDEYLDYLFASVERICTGYGPLGGVVFDGNWCRPQSDWKQDRLYSMIRKHQPQAIIMDNTGLERPGELDHDQIDAVTFEQHGLEGNETIFGESLAAMRWFTLNDHWAFSPRDLNFKSGREIIEGFTQCRRYGAVYTINLTPRADGSLTPFDTAILESVGRWNELFGDIIRRAKPTRYNCSGKDFILSDAKEKRDYYFCHGLGIAGFDNVTRDNRKAADRVISGYDKKIDEIRWLDNGDRLNWEKKDSQVSLECTGYPYGSNLVVRVASLRWS